MTNTEKRLAEFDEQYSPIIKDESNSSWKYGAPSPNSMKIFLSSSITQAIAEERERVRGILSAENYKLEEWYSSSERPDTLTHFEANQRNMKTRNEIQVLLASIDKSLTK